MSSLFLSFFFLYVDYYFLNHWSFLIISLERLHYNLTMSITVYVVGHEDICDQTGWHMWDTMGPTQPAKVTDSEASAVVVLHNFNQIKILTSY